MSAREGRIHANAALITSAGAVLAGAGLALAAATDGELGGLDLLFGEMRHFNSPSFPRWVKAF